ncbi:aspartyl-phosphate phosphatase Spo0E family protein [Halanaerobaculum tunisiense]
MLSNRNKGGIIITTSQKLKEEIEQMRIKLKLAIKETSLQSKRVNQISQELDRKILEYMIDKSKK